MPTDEHSSNAFEAPASPETLAAAEALRDSAQTMTPRSWRHRLLSHIPPGQFARYLCVGVFNTLFGYATFAVINFLLHRRHVPASYIFAYVLSNFINITVAYLGYKIFVFRTKGNYLREWLKAMAVYWSAFIPGLILLPIFVRLFNLVLPAQLSAFHYTIARADAAPYIANAFLLCFGVFYSFIGHKKVTFRERKSD